MKFNDRRRLVIYLLLLFIHVYTIRSGYGHAPVFCNVVFCLKSAVVNYSKRFGTSVNLTSTLLRTSIASWIITSADRWL